MADRPKILVVDDELPVCKSMAAALAQHSDVVECALSGEEALKKDQDLDGFDVVITDLMMPGISGMDLLKTMKENRPGTVVIMVTGYPSIRSAVESIKFGAYDYLPKPFTPVELRSVVSRALEHQRGPAEGKTPSVSETLPEGLYGFPNNTWVRVEGDERVTVGAQRSFVRAIGPIEDVEFPAPQESRYQGEACVRIRDRSEQIHRLWAPVTGRVLEINNQLKSRPQGLVDRPYSDGWLLRMAPSHLTSDLNNLVPLKEG